MADIAHLGFSVDTSGLVRAERAIDSLSRAARGLRDISLRVDVSGAAEAMRQLDRLDGRNISARVTVDVSGAAEATRELDRLSANRTARIDVTVAGIDALRSIDNLVNNRSIRIDANVTGISEALRDLDRLAVNRTVRIDANVTGISEALRDLDRLSGGARSVRIDVGINGVEAALRGLRDIERLAVNRTVRIDIDTGDIGRAISDLERLAQQARDAASEINGLGSNVNVTSGALGGLGGMAAGVIAGVIGVAVVIADATTDLIKYNAELNLLNSYLGTSRETMQVWGAAGKAAGVEIADVFKDVQEKIGEFAATGGGEAADVFKRLKLDVNDLIALSPDQQLLKIADAMSKVKDMSMGEKSFLLESLGNDATRLLPLLDNNAAKLRELDEIMRNSGSIITDDQNAVLQEAYSNMTLLQAASEGATNALGMVGAEILNAFAGDVVDAISGVGESIYTLIDEAYLVADAWSSTTGLMSEDASASADAIAGAFDWLMDGLAQGANELVELFRIGFTYLPNFAVAAFQAMIDYSMSWVHTASSGFNGIKSSAGNVFASIVDFAGSAFGSMQTIAGQVIGYIIGRLADMVDSVGGALSSMSVVPGMEDLSTNVAGIGSHLRELESAAKNSGAVVAANFSTMADGIRGSADESARAAQMSGLQAESSKLSAQYAIDNATAMMIESEGNRTRTIEMGKAERQFARLGSSLDGAGAAGKKFRVDQEAVNKALSDGKTKASESAKVTREHSDAMKQATESIAQRTLAVEHGTLAEQYYIERMKGVTDAEARRIVSGNQYLTYLEEQQSLTKDATAAHGGLLDAYRQKLDDAGLGSADKAFDAAKSSTDVAVDAAVKYRESIEAVTQAAKEAAAAVATIGTTSVSCGTNVSVGNAGTTNITGAAASTASAVVSKLQALGWGKNQAIGIAANLKQESEFRPSAVGDGGKAYGLAQWHPDRQANFAKAMGRNIQGSSVDDQLKFLTYEMTKGTERGAGNRLKDASSVAQAAAIVSRYYERPAATAEEMTRRAGIANGIAKSLGDAVPTFRAVTDETSKTAESATKVATAIGSNIPVLAETKSLTVEYGGVIEDKVVTAQMRANLEQQYMNGEAQKLIDTANEQAETIGKSGIAIRQNELNQKQFNVSQQAAIINAESALAYAEEEANLRKEMVAVKSPGLAAQYAAGLSDKTLTKDQIESLTGQKLQIEFTKNITELDGRAEKATLTAEAYQRLTLARDGFTESQINGQLAWETEVEGMEALKEANKRVAESFESDLQGFLRTGELDVKGFVNTVLDEWTRLYAVKPIMDAIFGKSLDGGAIGGGGGVVGEMLSMFGFADGGAFDGGVQQYATGGAFHNSVLSKPTQFFANGGLAVAGEAGAEAVMPLTRIGGRLGVQAVMPQQSQQPPEVKVSAPVTINLHEDASKAGQVQQTENKDGRVIDIFVANIRQGGSAARALESTYGVARRGI